VDIRSRANTRGLDYEHMIKARAHKGGMRIGKTPKKQKTDLSLVAHNCNPSYLVGGDRRIVVLDHLAKS
jgi:hypothetical protein